MCDPCLLIEAEKVGSMFDIHCARCGATEKVEHKAPRSKYIEGAKLCCSCVDKLAKYPTECIDCDMAGMPLINFEGTMYCPSCYDRAQVVNYSLYMRVDEDFLCGGYDSLQKAVDAAEEIDEEYYPIGIRAYRNYDEGNFILTLEV
jgi:hypothetical protein